MELLITLIIATFFVAISFIFAPCTASNQVINVQKSLEQVYDPAKFALTSLPRKLKLNENEMMKSSADKDNFTPTTKKLIEPSSVTKQHEKEENVFHAAGKGTSTSWINEDQGPNKSSEYFSMDYVWVRKRRPIHNKQIPYVP